MNKPIAFTLFLVLAACGSAPAENMSTGGNSGAAGAAWLPEKPDAPPVPDAGEAADSSAPGSGGAFVPAEPDGAAGVAGSAGGTSGSAGMSAAGGAGNGGASGSGGSSPMLCDGWKSYDVKPHGSITVKGGAFWLVMQASNPGAIPCSSEPWAPKNPAGIQTAFCFVDPSATQTVRFWIKLADGSRATVTLFAPPLGGVGFCP